MRKQREKVSIKAAALLLGAALLTGGCSGYQSSEELRKGAENVQAETDVYKRQAQLGPGLL